MNIGTLTVLLGVNSAGLTRAATNMRKLETQVIGSNARMQASFSMLATKMALVGSTMTQYITLPLGILGGVAVGAFGKFEYSLAKVSGLVGISADMVRGWGQEILNMSEAVGQTPAKLADALYYITTSGIRGSESMEILRYSALTASAGLSTATTVADALTSAINAYGKENLTAAHATDVLIAGIREAKTEPEQFASSIGKVFPVAAQLGASFEDVSAGLAAMTRTGTKAAEAATYLRRMFFTLIQEPPKAEEELNKLGLSFSSLRDTLRTGGLLPMLLELKEKVGDNTTVLADIFPNIRALIGVLDILGPNLENNKEIFEALTHAGGEFNTAVGAIENTVKHRWNQSMAALQKSMIDLGTVLKEPIMDLLKKLVGFIKNVIEQFTALDKQKQQNILFWSAVAVAIGPLSLALSGVLVIMKAIAAFAFGATIFGFVGPLLLLAGAAWYTYKNFGLLTEAVDNLFARLDRHEAKKRTEKLQKELEEIQSVWSKHLQKLDGFTEERNRLMQTQEKINILKEEIRGTNDIDKREESYAKLNGVLKEQYEIYQKLEGALPKKFKWNLFEVSDARKITQLQSQVYSGLVEGAVAPMKEDFINFDDFASGFMVSIGKDVVKVAETIKSKLAALDIFKISTQLEVGTDKPIKNFWEQAYGTMGDNKAFDTLLDLGVSVHVNSMQIKEQIDQSVMAALEEADRENKTMYSFPITISPLLQMKEETAPDLMLWTEDWVKNMPDIQGIIDQAMKDLETNVDLSKAFGLDKAALDIETLSNALSQLTTTEAFKLMDPAEIDRVNQMIEVLDKLEGKTKEVEKATKEWKGAFKGLGKIIGVIDKVIVKAAKEWKNLFRSLGTFLNSISKYFGEGFGEVISVIGELSRVVGQFINVVTDVIAVLKALNIIKKATVVVTELETGAEITNTGATIANTVAKTTEKGALLGSIGAWIANTAATIANTVAKVANAIASAVAWLVSTLGPLGLVLAVGAIAGIIALVSSGSKQAQGAVGMADGGIIPPGFPNDTFPAMLSSNEAVIPLTKLQKMLTGNGGNDKPMKVVFIQKGRELQGVMYAQSKITQSY